MDALKIIIPGLLSTVQDRGIRGYMASGFSQCGAMDQDSMYIANLLVGNNEEAAVIEMTLLGISALACDDITIAVTGGKADVFINGEKAEEYRALKLNKGDYLTVGPISEGCRAYLSIRGGVAVREEMGSRSTFIKIGIGGFHGRPLKSGDILPTEKTAEIKNLGRRRLFSTFLKNTGNVILRAVPGPQDDMFSKEEIDNFFSREYTVTPASDRMGIRLSGQEAIKPLKTSDIISDGIALGSVQVPKSGQPIILCADRQTTGGYAKIATVISSDMPLCAQLTPGEKLRFEKISVEDAQKILRKKRRRFAKLKKQLNK